MSPDFLPTSCPRHRRACRCAALVLAYLLAVVPFGVAVAAAAKGGGNHASPGPVGQAVLPRFVPSNSGSLSNSEITRLNTEARLSRLNTSVAQTFDIVPPANPRIPGRPLPGYQIVRLGRGHNNRLCLAGTVAGTKGLMMLDTGANNSALSDASYRSLLLPTSHTLPSGVPRAVNLNGTSIPLAEAPDYYVGRSNLGAVPVCLLPSRYLFDPSTPDGKGRAYDGLLGENILRHYNALIDCARLVMYLDIDPARKLNQASSFVRHGWTRVPMSDTGSHFTVPCMLNGHRYRLVVDTGSPFTNLNRELLSEAKVTSHDLPVRGGLIGTETEQVGLVDLDRLQIGGYTATGVHLTTTSQSLAQFDRRHAAAANEPIVGLLGGDILAGNGAVIDLGNRMLYLKHPVVKR